MKNDFSEILETVRTVDDKRLLLTEIGIIEDQVFKKNAPVGETLRTLVRLKIVTVLDRLLSKKGVSWEESDAVLEIAGQLKNALEELKTLLVTIALDPTEEILDMIYQWATQELPEKVVIDISVNKKIRGGAIIVFEGWYRAFTLDEQLEKFFKNHEVF